MMHRVFFFALVFVGVVSCTSTQKATPEIANTVTNVDNRVAQGQTIFENSCARCHDLPAPAKYTSVEWVGYVNSMAPRANLSDQQHKLVYEYLALNAKK